VVELQSIIAENNEATGELKEALENLQAVTQKLENEKG